MAAEMGFGEGFSLDLTTKDPVGRPWDFSKIACRRRCWELIKKYKPNLIIGTPDGFDATGSTSTATLGWAPVAAGPASWAKQS